MNDLRQLAEAATPGPWTAEAPSDDGVRRLPFWGVRCPSKPPTISHELCRLSSLNSNEDNDAAYIAACSPERILALLDALKNARAEAMEEAAKLCDAKVAEINLIDPHASLVAGMCAAAIRRKP